MTTQMFGERITERPEGMYVPIEFPEFARLDTETRDGRTILSEGFSMDEAPRTLYFQQAQATGHDGAVAVGRIDSMTIDGPLVTASGWVVDTPEGRMAAHLVKTGVLRGNSVDLSVREEDVLIDVDWSDDDAFFPSIKASFRNAAVTASTLVGKPAFHNAAAIIPDGWDVAPVTMSDGETEQFLVAAGARHSLEFATATGTLAVRSENFANPALERPTPVQIEDGVVYGHVAAWDSRHVDVGICPPRSASNYAYFATGAVNDDNGDLIATGRLVMRGNHADKATGWRGAIDHYANTCAAWADVAIGEDQHGIWIAGQVRPGTDDTMVHAARNSALSGDWRNIAGNMELIAVLSVNVNGFPIPRPSAYAVGSHQRSLLSAGVVPRSSTQAWAPPADFLADVSLLAQEARGRKAAVLRCELELDQ